MRVATSLRVVIAIVIAIALVATPLPAQAAPRQLLSIYFLDVGQGDAALIRTTSGKRILIDAGPSARAMEYHLWESDFDTLDLVVASHNHSDHIGGMGWVFKRFVVRALMTNDLPHTTNAYSSMLLSASREAGLLYLQPTRRVITVGDVRLRVLPPSKLDGSQNNNSVGILLEYGDFRVLFTGDAERKQIEHWLRNDSIPRVDIVKAGHHGARNGVTREWIAATRPADVIISASRMNSYGHPDPAVVLSWQAAGAKVYTTATDGPLFLAVQNGKYRISTRRNVLSAPIRTP
ncbi:MAG TPA: MBL fold metallo-hydrolase [Gemmatimonadaceae bacterium]|nr:MBL fold metallo-hydrolase [Gemmatimonadaceae bacterium]